MIQKLKKSRVRTKRPNIHISYDQQLTPCHRKFGELVKKYAQDNDSVLDVGCGVGHTLSEIKKGNPSLKLFAADIDDNTLAITKDRVELDGFYRINSVEDLFEMDLSFEVIVMSHVLEHTRRPLDVVQGLVQMLKPEGILVLAVPNPVRLAVFVGNIFKINYVNPGHVYAWDRSHWINFLENIAGLKVQCYSEDYFPLPFRSKLSAIIKPLEIVLARIFPWLSFSNIAIVKAHEGANTRVDSKEYYRKEI